MTITITIKRTPGTKEKDRTLKFETIGSTSLNLTDAKLLWEFEQLINGRTKSRIHVNLEE